ncbi:hypothetical protein Peur_032325 [Populus x canadensis]
MFCIFISFFHTASTYQILRSLIWQGKGGFSCSLLENSHVPANKAWELAPQQRRSPLVRWALLCATAK